MLCKRNRTTELSRNFYTWSRASPANLRSAASSRRASQSRNHWSRQYRLARSQWWPAARTSIAAGRDRAKAQTSPRKSAARFRQCRPKTQSRRGMSSSGISFEIIKEFVATYRAPLAGKIIVYPSCRGLKMTPLTELGAKLPLANGHWNKQAEEALVRGTK